MEWVRLPPGPCAAGHETTARIYVDAPTLDEMREAVKGRVLRGRAIQGSAQKLVLLSA